MTPLARQPLIGHFTDRDQVAALVLLNTYYCAMPTLRPPEAIFLFSTPLIRSVARPISGMFNHLIFRRMYWWQVGRFFRDAEIRNQFVPLLYQQFGATPSTHPAFFRLNEDLLPTIRSRSKMAFKLKELRRPVRIIFGASDPYLNKGVAQKFHELFPASDLFLLPKARHFVQMDEPEKWHALFSPRQPTQLELDYPCCQSHLSIREISQIEVCHTIEHSSS